MSAWAICARTVTLLFCHRDSACRRVGTGPTWWNHRKDSFRNLCRILNLPPTSSTLESQDEHGNRKIRDIHVRFKYHLTSYSTNSSYLPVHSIIHSYRYLQCRAFCATARTRVPPFCPVWRSPLEDGSSLASSSHLVRAPKHRASVGALSICPEGRRVKHSAQTHSASHSDPRA